MASHTPPPSLPIIDISPFLPSPSPSLSGPASRAATATALATACRDSGFFYLTGHGIPGATTTQILDLARRFFLESPAADKDAIRRRDPGDGDGDGARGYQKVGENVTKGKRDWHEAVDLYEEWEDQGVPEPPFELLKGRNLWPRHPPELRGVYEGYIGQLKEVGMAVVRAMGFALGLGDGHEDVFVDATTGSFWVMRMIGYPGLPKADMGHGDDESYSCGEHTDYGCVTLLLADSTTGALQVQTKTGDWLNADPLPGAFVVNIGDMMERWTNGLWKSTNHRVVHKGENYRVSVPFFFEPNFHARIRPLAKCVEESGGKEMFGEVVYGEHLISKVEGNFY
ncbi:Clavaminate synthase-like protein [Saccharata proteae CBS 121410]|uniref:Clavaminate synthase-like protein n=1 Tax=Saccharata proteae CBS 121410 TaxID=1314787 RepID=A0A9P4HZ76_9PEZI|nr:Clavaminate synthase-like protein [Saccharata proteae CBS 121410]